MNKKYRYIYKKIKENKIRLGIISGTFACLVGLSIGLGFASNLTTEQKNKNDFPINEQIKPNYVPNTSNIVPTKIEFDSFGKPIIPKLIDLENLAGKYEYSIDKNKEIDVATKREFIANDKDWFAATLISTFKERENDLLSLIPNEFLDKEVSLNLEMNKLIDYYIPNNSFNLNDSMTIEGLMKNLYSDAGKYTSNNNVSFSEINDLMALCGINFDKEYNNAYKLSKIENNNTQANRISLYGGGGMIPPTPGELPKPNLGIPSSPIGDIPIMKIIDSMVQDKKFRVIYEITYTSLALAISIFSLVMEFWTLGLSIIFAAIDLIFCGIAVAFAVIEYLEVDELINHYSLMKNIFNLNSNGLMTINILKEFGLINIKPSNYLELKKASWIAKRQTSIKILQNQARMVVISSCISVFAIALAISKSILDQLIIFNEKYCIELNTSIEELYKYKEK